MPIRISGDRNEDSGKLTRFISTDAAGITTQASPNYFGDKSDGDLSTTVDVNLTSTLDGDMIVKNYGELTVNAGHTLTTTNRCKGLLIYVSGNLTVNGTISMSSRGANVNPTTAGVSATGLRLPMRKGTGTDTLASADFAGCGTAATTAVANQVGISGDGTIYFVERTGGVGGGSRSSGGALTNGTGGGGGGGAKYDGTGGTGGTGTCFSGGAGGGTGVGTGEVGGDGGAYGGAGGDGNTNLSLGASGGAGNPGGSGDDPDTAPVDGENGTGGLLIILVGGNVTIGATGVISAYGAESPASGASIRAGGSGGGRIILLYEGGLTQSGTVSARGGYGGYDGGSGATTIEKVGLFA
jgi:hypothetical protein